MPTDSRRATRAPRGRARATHSREQIVDAAIAMLDREGASGLTLRGLAAELGGGLGSVYWHVAGKGELMELALEQLFGRALDLADADDPSIPSPPLSEALPEALDAAPQEVRTAVTVLRRTCLALHDEMAQHPWLASQALLPGMSRRNALVAWERLGRQLAAMGLTVQQQFHGSTALTGYVVGISAEMASQDGTADQTRPKDEQLGEITEAWQGEEYADFPWIRSIADAFRTHDDLVQFAAGLDLLLLGLVQQALRA